MARNKCLYRYDVELTVQTPVGWKPRTLKFLFTSVFDKKGLEEQASSIVKDMVIPSLKEQNPRVSFKDKIKVSVTPVHGVFTLRDNNIKGESDE